MNFVDYIKENKDKILLTSIIATILTIIIGCIILPDIFYDNFIWKYFWGPILSDAQDKTVSYNGIDAADKFTWLSELIYGLMVLIVIYYLYKLIKKWDISIDSKLFLGVFPFILIGTIARVFEDSNFFTEPFVYWFITPLIYIQIVIWVIVLIIVGHFLEIKFKENKYISIPNLLLSVGTIILIPFIFYIIVWFTGGKWGPNQGDYVDVFLLIIGIVSLITFLVYLISRFFRKNENIAVFSKPINLAMIFGHLIDGITSWISIYDPFNMDLPTYFEKHPASDLLMNIWPPLFPIVKFLLVILIIYIFDVLYKEELRNYQKIVYILKIVIFLLGFAPGLRDLLRVAMGV